MTAEKRQVSDAPPLAYTLVRRVVTGQAERLADAWRPEDFDLVPSGSARLAVMQSAALAALAVHRLAELEQVPPLLVLDDLWATEGVAPDWGPSR